MNVGDAKLAYDFTDRLCRVDDNNFYVRVFMNCSTELETLGALEDLLRMVRLNRQQNSHPHDLSKE